MAINPHPFLLDLVGKPVIVKLKWGSEYHGILLSTDAHMNVEISNVNEWISGNLASSLGTVIIKCNNVLYIKQPLEEEEVNPQSEGFNLFNFKIW